MAKTIQEKFGERVKELRTEKKISQEKLGNIANIDRTYMNSLENGRRNVSLVNVEKILNALDADFSEFFDSEIFKTPKRKRK
ncbi:MAG TPA: helix-turn-helix transcriptional regulator [Chitinophagales bacterium]|nr:helix-turn-helix transcriptional regulator [Chitinophagales bacterium]